jgi:GAF domain-containing protein
MRRDGGSTQPVKGRRADRPKTPKVLTAALSIADLQRQVGSLTRELEEAREERTATADVLNVISRSAFDLHAVLQTLVESAARLCDADMAQITRQREGVLSRAEAYGFPEQFVEYSRTIPVVADRGSAMGRALLEGRSVHVPDALADREYTFTEAQRLANFRTVLAVPMLREGAPIGVIVMTRKEARPFTQKQIELATTFADQAVIAIENVRLFDEVRAKSRDLEESLQQQTATSEVLQIISSSPGHLAPVFESMLANATRVCGANFGTMNLYEDGSFHPVAHYNVPSAYPASLAQTPFKPHPQSGLGTVARTHQVVHIEDIRTLPPYLEGDPSVVKIADLARARTYFVVPMLKENDLIGAITIYRQEVKPFTAKQTELVANFAKQAVIAIENVRLITETREALERQTATAEVLQVINSSPGDLAPVFQSMLEKAHSLCGVSHGSLQLYDGEKFRAVAVHGISAAFANRLRQGFVPGPNHPSQPLLKGARFAQAPDCAETDDPLVRAAFELAGFRTVLFIPLRKDGNLLGQIAAARQEVRPFTEKEIALLENFAAQAVIAMENARLLTEQREALERQTATADVLQAINSSPGDLAPVFETILEKAHSLCTIPQGSLLLYDGEKFRAVASRGLPEALAARMRQGFVPGPNHPSQRLLEGARFTQVTNWAEIDHPIALAALDAGVRTTLFIPLRREGKLLGYIGAARSEVKPFSEKEIALLESFAAQAVIAMENARLLGELRERQTELARSVDELTATGDVLKIISRSTTDLETVLDTLVETVARLCRADQALIFRRRDDLNYLAAAHGVSGEARQFMVANPLPSDRGTLSGRVGLERRVVHIPDVMQDEEYTYWEAQKKQGQRTMLGVPLLRGDSLIGIFSITRTRVDPFTPKEIELATTFADQAVIAIENARLFEELRERQAELRVTFDNMGDGVVMFGTDTRLVAWNRNFQTILDLPDAFLAQRPSYARGSRRVLCRSRS